MHYWGPTRSGGVCCVLCVQAKSLQSCLEFVIPWTIAHQAPLSMGFSRPEYWSGLPFLSPDNLPDPGIKPESPALAGRFFTTSATWEAHYVLCVIVSHFQLCDPMDCSLPGSSVRELFQARMLECIAPVSLLQGIFLTQGLNPGLPHWGQSLYPLSH